MGKLADKQGVMISSSATTEGRKYRRLLCSDLITVHWASGRGFAREEVAVLEDYSANGAGLYITTRIEPGEAVTIRTAGEAFGGQVKRCTWRDDAWLLGIEFDETRSGEALFQPDHLVDPEELGF